MKHALAITLSLPTALYAQPAPTDPVADPEPAPGVEPSPTTPTAPEPPAPPTPQPTPAGTPAKTLGIDVALVLPLSDYADDAKVGFGALARYEIPRGELFAFTLRGGALLHAAAEDRDTLLLFPLLFGIRFADPWFVTVDAGLVLRHQGETNAALGLAFGGGYRKGKLSFRAEILVPDLGAADSTAGVMGSGGLTF